MQVTLIGKKFLYKVVLPKVPIGNYWLTDKTKEKERKLVNIEGQGSAWIIKTDGQVNVINPKAVEVTSNKIGIKKTEKPYNDFIVLQEHCMYAINFGNTDEVYILYCSPVYDTSTTQFKIINNKEIYIGRNDKCEIKYNNRFISDVHARLFYMNGKWNIENYDKKVGTFVNDVQIKSKEKSLQNGDIIYILGLKIILIGNHIFINNPSNNIIYKAQRFEKVEQTQKIIEDNNVAEDDQEIELYTDKDYFSRAPRIKKAIEEETIKIDPPPQNQNQEDMPAILMLGSSLSMGLMMLISMSMTINRMSTGTSTVQEMVGSVLITGTLLLSIILFPILIQRWNKNRKKKREKKRQEKYKEYLEKKKNAIMDLKRKQKEILYENYVSVEDCSKIILKRSSRLWERKPEDFDFLDIRLGIGDVPLKVDLRIPEEQFSIDDDNLLDILHETTKEAKTINQAPICTSLVENNVSAMIVRDDEIYKKMMQSIIIQLITFHSYEDLKIVFLVKKENEKYWEYVKMLPHVWDSSKEVRFFADDFNDMREISMHLEQELKERRAYANNNDKINYSSFPPYYLIITDDYKRIETLPIINQILESKKNLGFSLLCITKDLAQLPSECKSFISLENNKGMIFDSELSEKTQREIQIDTSYTIFFERLIQIISNIPIRYSSAKSLMLPNMYTFLEMYDVGLIEQLNILERWNKNDSTVSLKVPVGIDTSGMPIELDIHERAHGPHGLIAGSTGSGKSEFIITYILSMAINYHPNDVAFLLIDYKGGGLAGAFQKGNIKLPHLIGTITNIETNGLRRSLASIQSELKRRQIIFNEARNMIDEGTIDIYKYQKLFHEGVVKQPVPHLLIICDEFAELKQQQEEFMDELISVSRIGRSLGVHLILSTQKPAGIVNDQIRSNSKFAICLKVQTKEDSIDVIQRADAANLKGSGQFFMQVGNDDLFVLGQSAWTGAPYYPSNVAKKKIDNSIQFVSNVGTSIKKVEDIKQNSIESYGEQLTNVIKYISKIASREGIKSERLWLEDIPESIYIKDLKAKYHNDEKEDIIATIGEYDDPYNQKQGPVKINFLQDGNLIVYGNAESGKETLLSTLTYDLMTSYSSDDVWIYILDFGSEALKIFKNSPHVGDVVFLSEAEKIDRFFDMIQREIKTRRKILSNYNGDYQLYRKSNNEKMPMIVVMVNSCEAFLETYEYKYDDLFLSITREGAKCGIYFAVTTSTFSDLRFRLKQNFGKKIGLQINNEDDYLSIFENAGKKKPSHLFGRGLVALENKEVYEFQTAKICQDVDYNPTVTGKIKELNKTNKTKAYPIPIMPERILLDDIKEYIKDLSCVPLGIYKRDLRLCNYNFKDNFVNILTSKNISNLVEFASYIIEELTQIPEVKVEIFDTEKALKVDAGLKEYVENFANNIYSNKNTNDSENNTSTDKKEFTICIINGIDKYLNEIQTDTEFCNMLQQAEEIGNYGFIIIDTTSKLKNHEYDKWYKRYLEGDTGIYIGSGVDDQYLISINERRGLINNCGRSFGYVIKQGKPTHIKLIGMKELESSDEDE